MSDDVHDTGTADVWQEAIPCARRGDIGRPEVDVAVEASALAGWVGWADVGLAAAAAAAAAAFCADGAFRAAAVMGRCGACCICLAWLAFILSSAAEPCLGLAGGITAR